MRWQSPNDKEMSAIDVKVSSKVPSILVVILDQLSVSSENNKLSPPVSILP